ncbi:hypothetical protein HYALB_00011859 [Hymenoscyphus albidus]|uniref:FAD/NAD(P)-binding domain-containing protein n=1 Tax=Hymenoscyphus albidus TaxID=595503 RepID=A0A9N9LK61_9HELO|nr:hypothetical protein HYALB_00011859 [Hymenoscyphus albidus]
MALPRMDIVIIGGSNTGLMNGIVLKRLGHNVHILEKNTQTTRSDLAAGITTHPAFEKFMEVHDKSQEPWSIVSPGLQFLNKDGGAKRKVEKALHMTSWGFIYHRLRANFDGLASEFCKGPPPVKEEGDGDVIFDEGKVATAVELVGEKVKVTYDDVSGEKTKENLSIMADFVIIANGANSSLRAKLFPGLEREYAGYVAFRGTVPESEVSEETKKVFDPRLSYYTYKNGYILLYIIPGQNGSLTPGSRRYNWVWYHPLPSTSPSFPQIMTDTHGTLHRNTLPAGTMSPTAWSTYTSLATTVMNPPFNEVIQKTSTPFITAISDIASPSALALSNKVLLAGEALNLVRPHLALSTTSSASQALLLESVFKGEIGIEEWERRVLYTAKTDSLKTNAFGTFLLYGFWTAAGWAVKLLGAVVMGMWPFRLFGGKKSG